MDSYLKAQLLAAANRYIASGYRIGLTLGKVLLVEYETPDPWKIQRQMPDEWDGISIIPEEIVVVDFDCDFKDLGWRRDLPPTLKEKTPRGWHLYYKLPKYCTWKPRIKFQPEVDLLVKGKSEYNPYPNRTSKKVEDWGGHVLCTPTPGYSRIWPSETPTRDNLTWAPRWLIDEVTG